MRKHQKTTRASRAFKRALDPGRKGLRAIHAYDVRALT